MADDEDLGPIPEGQRRVYRTPDGDIDLFWQKGSQPKMCIGTIGREAHAVQSPPLEAWVRRVTADPGVHEVWTGQWYIADADALERTRQALLTAGAVLQRVHDFGEST